MASFLFDRFYKLSEKINKQEDDWEYSEEPHVSRRREILLKYPEIKKLMGYDPSIAYIVLAEVLAQVFFCYLLQDANWSTVLIMAYTVGGCLNHSLGSAIHEIGHNLAFGHGRPLWNRALGIFSNLPMGIPLSVTYKKYHSDHHRYLGHDTMDVDVPTVIESYLFRHPITKILWLIIHPAIHGVRPFLKSPKPLTILEIINLTTQMAFNVLIFYTFGVKSLVYLVAGTLMALGLHPLAGHFISEHYLFDQKTQGTYSYYGPLNAILFNVGYHVEHHDFPYISYKKLPKVREIASEYYDNLPYHTSWLKVLWDFIFDPDMGPQGRAVGYIKDDVSKAKVLREEFEITVKNDRLNKEMSNGHSNGHANGHSNGFTNGHANGHSKSVHSSVTENGDYKNKDKTV